MRKIKAELDKRIKILSEKALHGKTKRVRDESRGAFNELQDLEIWLANGVEQGNSNCNKPHVIKSVCNSPKDYICNVNNDGICELPTACIYKQTVL